MSIPILALAAWISGETLTQVPGPLALSLLAYQAFWVVGLTFLLWFGLVKTYSASKLSAFTFITPLFGVIASYFIMHDTLTLAFGAAALLVIAGLFLVNKPERGGSHVVSDSSTRPPEIQPVRPAARRLWSTLPSSCRKGSISLRCRRLCPPARFSPAQTRQDAPARNQQ